MRRARRGYHRPPRVGAANAVIVYEGLDRVQRETTLCFEPTPSRMEAGRASYALTLAPQNRYVFHVSASCRGGDMAPTIPFLKDLRRAQRQQKKSQAGIARVETASTPVNELLTRSSADFYMLVSQTEHGPYPYAGIPWYSTTFGRDGIIAAMQMLWLDPSIARGVLRRLAALQAKASDPRTDAEPGKILHEMRHGEMSSLGEVPFGQYYGSVDATPLFIALAGMYGARTGDDATLREIWPSVERALTWMDVHGDRDGDGFIEYHRGSETGLSNQGWKDSYDAVFHADGSLAEGAIMELQPAKAAARAIARVKRIV